MKGENFQMKPEEQKSFRILATILELSHFRVLDSVINYLSFFIAIVALIFKYYRLYRQPLKKRKRWPLSEHP